MGEKNVHYTFYEVLSCFPSSICQLFFLSVLDDLHKLSYSFLDEKRWMEARDYLTQAIIVFDCLKKSGFQKKDDSTMEENTFLLRAACGLKLVSAPSVFNRGKWGWNCLIERWWPIFSQSHCYKDMSYVYMYKTNHLFAKFDFRHISAMIIIMSHIYTAQNANRL